MTAIAVVSRLVAASVLLTAASAPSLASAQEAASSVAGPRAGTWGAELALGAGQSATLLRFRSPTWAWLLTADFALADVKEEGNVFGGGTEEQSSTNVNLAVGVGFRRYQATTAAFRAFTSLGLLAGYLRDFGGPGWTAGAFGELGGSYFFSPHLSLGASGGLQVVYSRGRREFGGLSTTSRSFGVRASAVQVLAAVYF